MLKARKSFVLTLVAAALLIPLIFVAIASAQSTPSHQFAGDYTVLEAPTLSGPPTTENGVTTVSGTVPIELRGTGVGSAIVSFTLALGVNGAPNTGDGSFFFEGSIAGRIGTLEAILENWIAGGDEAFTSAHFKLVPGSGTGDLWNLVEYEGFVQRDETAVPAVGITWGTYRFEGDETPSTSVQFAGDYTIALPVLSGPPVTENGVTTIAGAVDVETRGTQIGSSPVEFTCVLGTGGAPNVCEGSFVFEGSLRGRIGTYEAVSDNWASGGDAAFANAHFVLVPGSGTGDLSNLVELEVTVLRDEAVERRVGAYFGTMRFEGDQTPTQVDDAPMDLSDYSVGELFEMEKDGQITTDELAAELERRNS